MAKEFLPDSPEEIPVLVTVREKKVVTVDLTDWLNEGETLLIGDLAAVLKTREGDQVIGGASVQAVQGPGASVFVDWTQALRNSEYYLWLTMTKGGRIEEGYLRFRTHPV